MSKCVITGCVLVHPDEGLDSHTRGDLYDGGSFWVVVFNPNWQRSPPPEGSKIVCPTGDHFIHHGGTFVCDKGAARLSEEATAHINGAEERLQRLLNSLGGL